jgi:hypothetical protein
VALPIALAAGFMARAGLQVTSCVDTPGVAGWLGTRFALVHADPACASGTMAPGGTPAQVLTVLACATLPVLFAHLGAAIAALHLFGRSVAAVRRLRGAIVRIFVRVMRVVPGPMPEPTATPAPPDLPPLTPRPVLAVPALRAPPLVAAA